MLPHRPALVHLYTEEVTVLYLHPLGLHQLQQSDLVVEVKLVVSGLKARSVSRSDLLLTTGTSPREQPLLAEWLAVSSDSPS